MKFSRSRLASSTLATFIFGCCMHFAVSPAMAGTVASKNPVAAAVEPFDPFAKGRMEFELLGGALFSLDTNDSATRPDTAYGFGSARLGWMLNDPSGSGLFRGNWEFLVGGYGAGIFDGPGDVIAGGALGIRYNFVQPSAKVVPFIQIGGGGAYSDMADDDLVQRLVGEEWSWELEGSVGLRFMMSERCSLIIAAQYQHLSNAGRNERNRGLNALGGVIGVSWFY